MKKSMVHFVVFTYLTLYAFFLVLGISIYILKAEALTYILTILAAWSSTIVFIIIFKKVYPEDNLKSFIKRQFSVPIEKKILLQAIFFMTLIFIGVLLTAKSIGDRSLSTLVTLSLGTLVASFFLSLIRGPLGEELGWRAFFMKELDKKFSVLLSGLITGLLWGFWHLPLWLVSGYQGIELLIYAAAFLCSIVCCTIIMAVLYRQCKNLLIPIIIHQLNNYFMEILIFDEVEMMIYFAIFYILATLIICLINRSYIINQQHRANKKKLYR